MNEEKEPLKIADRSIAEIDEIINISSYTLAFVHGGPAGRAISEKADFHAV